MLCSIIAHCIVSLLSRSLLIRLTLFKLESCALFYNCSLHCFIAQPFIARHNCGQSSSLLDCFAIGETSMCLSKLQQPRITDYVVTILNKAEYYYKVKHKTKLFEIKTYEVLGLQPWIIFHPSSDLRNVGITVNLVARLHGPRRPFKTAKSAWKYCGGEGIVLGFGTRQELKAIMTRPRVHACVCMRACARACACAHTHPCVNVRTCVHMRA